MGTNLYGEIGLKPNLGTTLRELHIPNAQLCFSGQSGSQLDNLAATCLRQRRAVGVYRLDGRIDGERLELVRLRLEGLVRLLLLLLVHEAREAASVGLMMLLLLLLQLLMMVVLLLLPVRQDRRHLLAPQLELPKVVGDVGAAAVLQEGLVVLQRPAQLLATVVVAKVEKLCRLLEGEPLLLRELGQLLVGRLFPLGGVAAERLVVEGVQLILESAAPAASAE